MTLHRERNRYNVFTTEQFEELWRRSIGSGVIDAAVGQNRLDSLISFLSVDPYRFPSFDTVGEFVDMRYVNFMPNASPAVEIWYSVVEDDKAVILISVELNYPAQSSLPGFDF